MYTACFTGHRPNKLGGYNENNPIIQHVREQLALYIDSAIQQGVTTFISGMALGVDQLAAQLVLDTSATLVAAVPFEGQESNWPIQSQRKFTELLSRCHHIEYVCEHGYEVWKMQKRNEWMVDNSHLVIAVWDGTSGGTGNCVKYAEKVGRTIWRINPREVI